MADLTKQQIEAWRRYFSVSGTAPEHEPCGTGEELCDMALKALARSEEALTKLKLAFGEFAHATGEAEGVWFVGQGETHKLAEECEQLYLASRSPQEQESK